jgi:hypothetical protein
VIYTDPGTAALLEGRRFVAKPYVQVVSAGGGEDLSSRVVAMMVNASMDSPVMSATVSFPLSAGLDSLSPFIGMSMHNAGGIPLMVPAATVYIAFEISPDGAPGGFPIEVCRGRLDRVRINSRAGTIELLCRDQGSVWLNTPIFRTVILGSDVGVEASEVMINIQQFAGLSGSAPIFNITSPSLLVTAPADWMVLTYAQEPMPALEAMRIIAQQAGRDVRWFESNGASLRYYEPDRAVSVPDLVLNDRRYQEITGLEWGDEDVRNIWEVQYQAADSSFPPPITVFDQPSIDLYGPRPARIFINRADNVRTDEAATKMVTSALADSKDPFASHSIIMPIEPRVELNDIHLYEPNYRDYDIPLQFAVAAFKHEWTAGERGRPGIARTTIGARAKPIAAYRDYRRSVPPKNLVSTLPVPADLWAPEGTVHYQVDDLTPP